MRCASELGRGPPLPPFSTESAGLGVKVASRALVVGRIDDERQTRTRSDSTPMLCMFMLRLMVVVVGQDRTMISLQQGRKSSAGAGGGV